MKYGLMYYKETDNIGDDIQSYAAMRFLPHIDYYIDRESLNCFIPQEKEYVSMIMNGWFLHNKLAWPPSPYINPLCLSMHFTSLESIDVGDKYLKKLGGEYLKQFGTIGARDIETQKRLETNGIKAYFSGCMTLTINKFDNIKKVDKICLVDLEENIVEKIKENTNSEIEILTHWLNQEETAQKDFTKRMNDVENLLKKYQESKLVITNRLHVALPCLALGTPVILIHKAVYEKDRLETFLKFMPNYVDKEFINMDIKELLKNPKLNNEEYLIIRNSLIQKCEEFINKCERSDLNIDKLPEIDEYYKNYVSKIEWFRKLHEETYKKSKQTIFNYENKIKKINENQKQLILKQEEKIKDIEEEKEKLINEKKLEIKFLKDKNESLLAELDRVYNTKGWKILEKIRKIKRPKK